MSTGKVDLNKKIPFPARFYVFSGHLNFSRKEKARREELNSQLMLISLCVMVQIRYEPLHCYSFMEEPFFLAWLPRLTD
jgi:hypothetical protein